jgi:predicted transcriptional regulator
MGGSKKTFLSKLIVLTKEQGILMMKCLSLKQPYSELIVSGRKTIELRKWNTKFRGQFLIHASKTINSEACKLYNIDIPSLITGAIVGSAMLYDVKTYHNKREFLADRSKHFAVSTYSEHMYGFLLSDAKRYDNPTPLKGRLGFFDVSV